MMFNQLRGAPSVVFVDVLDWPDWIVQTHLPARPASPCMVATNGVG